MTSYNSTPLQVALVAGDLRFNGFAMSDPTVTAEAARWTTGVRASEVPAGDAEGVELSPFANAALTLGAQMLTYGAEAGGIATLAGTVVQLADRAETASAALADDVTRASKAVTEAASTATREAANQTTAALTAAAKHVTVEIGTAVTQTKESLQAELGRLLIGADAPMVKAVEDLVAKQLSLSAVTMQSTFRDALGSVSATLDVGNPTSPLAKLETRIGERQDRQHTELTAQVKEVREAVAAATTAAQTATAVAAARSLSPAKGRPFEEAIGTYMEQIAAGLGGTYTATGDAVGSVRGCKKGDGVLELPSADGIGTVRIAIEMTTTGASRKWSSYLDETERNREAHASLGIVPNPDLVPGGAMLAPVGLNRLVVAFGEDGDPSLLRAACVLLGLRAQRDLMSERAGADLTVVDNRLAESQQMLVTLTDVIKTATGVKTGAAKVVVGLEALQEALARCLSQARAALVAGAANNPASAAA
jgi:hypothetical protein